ncbi:DnaJ C-terminal domain-containing protein [Thiomicrorhabdus xiamenensis]|uniref:DnaJ C-terminal domain-containing protein n=1 Tax=Thiomicrorhabdus xiamenensis TaxID=2739063 RepID=UPI001EEC345D|nr:DnaJ C-terminal domain-containing protein [Thiomicrorhabdus xiamenensis]
MINHFDSSVDYFAILGVHYGACPKAVKQAYRKMARRFHPDVSKIHNAQARFQQVAEAYEVLDRYREDYCRAYEQHSRRQSNLWGASVRPDRAHDFTRDSAQSSQGSREQKDFVYRQKQNAYADGQNGKSQRASEQGDKHEYRFHFDSYGQRPVDGKHREVVYPMTLRYAIRLLRLGSFYIPGLKLQMKFTRQAFEGKTFRLRGKGYKGLFGGKPGDYLVRFNIKIDEKRFRLDGDDIYAQFEVSTLFLQPGKALYLDSPSGRVEWMVPADADFSDYIRFRGMGLPADEVNPPGDLYAKVIPV